jgi:hypothetical protein
MTENEVDALKEWREAHAAYESLVDGGSIDDPKRVDFDDLVAATTRLQAAAKHANEHRTGTAHQEYNG